MKKNIFKTLAVSFVFASLVLTGCVQNFDGTKPNYSQKKQELTGNTGKYSAKGLNDSDISVYNEDEEELSYYSSYSIDQASENTWIEVVFEDCEFELDQDSVVKGLSFVKLKNNSVNNGYAPEHDGELPKTLIRVEEPTSYIGDVSFYFRVDTRTVETRRIALVVDATKIEYANGSDVISNDGNLKAGEETDSFVVYITIDKKADGTQTTQLGSTIGGYHAQENFAWTWGISPSDLSFSDYLHDSAGKLTGVWRYELSAPRLTYDMPYTYDESLAGTLSKMFKLQTQKPGTTKWVDETLTFTYHTADSTTPTTDPYDKNTYTTDVPAMEPGTKWRIVHDSSVSIGTAAPAYKKDYYLHPEFKDKRKVITKVSPSSSDNYWIVSYANVDTEYICRWQAGTFTESMCAHSYAKSAQQSMFIVDCPNNEYILITPAAGVDLATVDGFVLVNDNGNGIIETETTVHKNTSDVIDYITIAPKNKNFSGTVRLYVNEKTTLKTNSYNAKQLKFGFYPQPNANQGEFEGHYQLPSDSSTYTINLRTDTISPGVKQGVPSDITDYSIVYVDDYNEPERWHYLTPGTYYFIFYNGYNDNAGVLEANGLSPNYIAECAINNLNGTNSHGYGYSSAGAGQTFTISSAGWYEVKCFNNYKGYNYYKGYLAYCIYQN